MGSCPRTLKLSPYTQTLQSVAYDFDMISFLVCYTHAYFNFKPSVKGTNNSPTQEDSVSGDNDVYMLVVISLILFLNKMLKM